MNRSTPGLPVHHQLPEFTQTRVHQVSDVIQPSHPLVIPFSSCPQSLPASGSFPMSQLFAWGGQSIGVSASTLVLPMYTQDWSPLGWTGWISLQSKGLSRVFFNTTVSSTANICVCVCERERECVCVYLSVILLWVGLHFLWYSQKLVVPQVCMTLPILLPSFIASEEHCPWQIGKFSLFDLSHFSTATCALPGFPSPEVDTKLTT